jgi:PAS domain S-box-containing protein
MHHLKMATFGMPFLCALMVIAWFDEIMPSLLAMALALLAFRYCSVIPSLWLTVTTNEISRLLIFSLGLVSTGAVAQTAVETPRTIRVVMDNAYAPYLFQSNEGKLQGVLIDQWQAWGRRTGIKVEIHAMDWGEALRRMRAGEFDVIDCIVETAERRDYFDFTPPYATIEASIFFRSDISGIRDLASLTGFPVGVKVGDQHVDLLKANGVTTVIPFANNDELIKAARQHKINVFVADAPSAVYLLNKMGIDAEFRHSAPIFRDGLRRAVRKGNASLLHTVSEGFAAIEPRELTTIHEKWFGSAINRYGRYLTYAGYAAVVAILLIAALARWNRTLGKAVLQRTAALGESEQRFRRLIEMMPVAVYVCDTSGIITSYNRRAVELWGREPQLGHSAQRYCGSLHLYSTEGELIPHAESKMAEVLRTGVQARDLEVVIERPDGSRITVLVNIVPLRGDDGELMGAMNCFLDITERKRVENALRDAASQLEALSRRLVALQESERKELARELHDRIGQSLTALNINLNILSTSLPPQASKELRIRLADSEALVESTTAAIGNVMSDLRPPMLDDQGLVPALNWYAKQFSARTGVAVEVRSGEADERPAPDTEIALFRVAQEALNNVVKHARASRVEITLARSGTGHMMSVQDNGMGIDVAKRASPRPGLGLITMRERAQAVGGRLEVQTVRGSGTRLTVRVAA